MVGLALVAAMAVFGASLSQSATSAVDDAISANLIVTTGNGAGGFSNAEVAKAAAVPGVTESTAAYSGQFEIRGVISSLTAVATQHLSSTAILRMTAGSPGAL